jgi:tetratricopeptide (TPR) repeat protein
MRIPVYLLLLIGSASSRDAAALLVKGNVLYQSGELARAVAAYEACLELDVQGAPSAGADAVFVPCMINLASVLVDLGGPRHLDRAEELYRTALAAEPDNGDAAFNLALLVHDQKSDESTLEASELYQIAVTAQPERWDAWANLAAALQELKKEPLRAVHAFERAILLLESGEERGATRVEDAAAGHFSAVDATLSKLYYGEASAPAAQTRARCSEKGDTRPHCAPARSYLH